MSTIANNSITVRCIGVPENLRGATLPIDLVSENGVVTATTLHVYESGSTTFDVEESGKYSVRTQLPDGRWLVSTSLVDGNEKVATLSFNAAEPASKLTEEHFNTNWRSNYQSRTPRSFGLRDFDHRMMSSSLSYRLRPILTVDTLFDPMANGLLVIHFAVCESKKDSSWLLRSPKINDSLESYLAEIPGTFAESDVHTGANGDTRDWYPMIGLALWAGSYYLFCWPPSRQPSLTFAPDLNAPGDNGPGERLLVSASHHSSKSTALFDYMRRGALDQARRITPDWLQTSESLLAGKVNDPMSAILGAYVLLRLGNREKENWMLNLASWFKRLPDGAIIYGWSRLKAGDAKMAAQWFHTALRRGLPMYTEGVRLLSEGLAYLHRLLPEDEAIAEAAQQAYRIFASANMDSECTCLLVATGGYSKIEITEQGIVYTP